MNKYNNNNIEKKLRAMQPKPLTSKEKNVLWTEIRGNMTQDSKPYSRQNYFSLFFARFNYRFAFALVLLVIFLSGSTITLAAVDAAMPGDLLFPVDLASEKLQLIFSSDNKQTELRIKFANERLEEAQIALNNFLALAETVETVDSSSTSSASTTDQTGAATSTTDTAEDQETATSTQTDASGSETSEETNTDTEGLNVQNIEQTVSALTIAFEHLQNTRNAVEERGNTAALAAIDSIIGRLTALAENHASDLDTIKIRIRDRAGKNLRVDIETLGDRLKTRFRFEQKENGLAQTKIEIREGNSKTKIKIRGDTLKLEYKYSNAGGNNEGDNEDGDEDDNDDGRVTLCHIPRRNSSASHTIRISGRAIRAHLAHGDTIGACEETDGDEEDDDNATSTPDTTAPVISNLSSDPATTTVSVRWNTDEESNSGMWYDTVTPLIISSTTKSVNLSDLVDNHVVSLSELTASTTYYFVVTSTDANGNTSTSTESSFTTLSDVITEPEDSTPPSLSNITTTDTTTTSTDISWSTDENATSSVWYSTTTPLVTSSDTTQVVSSGNLVVEHVVELASLNEDTTYYYIVGSTDESGNTSTSTENSFVTLSLPDTTAPTLSDISASTATSTAGITWSTDESSDSAVWYDTTPSFAISSTTLGQKDSGFVLSHSVELSGLTASITYWFPPMFLNHLRQFV